MLIKKNINKIIKLDKIKKKEDEFKDNIKLINKLDKNEKYILNNFQNKIEEYVNDLLITTNISKKLKNKIKNKKEEYLNIFVNIINNLDNIFKQMNTLDNIILYKNITNEENLKKLYFYYLNKKTDKKIIEDYSYLEVKKNFQELNIFENNVKKTNDTYIILKINISKKDNIPFIYLNDKNSILLPRNINFEFIKIESLKIEKKKVIIYNLKAIPYKYPLKVTKYYFYLAMQNEMFNVIKNIPNLKINPINYIFEVMKFQHIVNTLWLEFGVYKGNSINYISKFTSDKVYGFDSFEGLPEKWKRGFEKGVFSLNGDLPKVNNNVVLIKGWFNQTLQKFIEKYIIKDNKKVSFLHLDADLYSSTIYVLNMLKNYLDKNCIVIFDDLVNFKGFEQPNSELRALCEFLDENIVDYSWIGMNGKPFGMKGVKHEKVALILHSVKTKK